MFTTNPNSDIIRLLQNLRSQRQSDKQIYQVRAYDLAIYNISQLDHRITYEELQSLPGIGERIRGRILHALGQGPEIQDTPSRPLSEKEKTIQAFCAIDRVGESTANKWYDAGYRQLKDIPQTACTGGQWVSLQLYDELHTPIPRATIDRFSTALAEHLSKLSDNPIQFQIAGSYRRGKAYSNDIDVCVLTPKGRDAKEEILSSGWFVHTLAQGSKKYLGILQFEGRHHRIDLEFATEEQYPYTLLYFTGPKRFNILMRNQAENLGYSLDEKGIFERQSGKPAPLADTEQQIFTQLNLEYLTPEQRDAYA